MMAAKSQTGRVVLAKALERVREIEAKHYVRDIGTGYKNYLRTDTADLKTTALASLVTAFQNGYSAIYIVIEAI